MDTLLVRSARIIDRNSPFHNKKADVLIEGGVIKEIGKKIQNITAKEYESDNLHVSPGWFDMQVHFCDPGYEYKEDILSGIEAAAAGGFTGVACMPSTLPPLHNKSGIEYVVNKARGAPVDVFPVGAITHKLEGKEINEMYDMHRSGAIAFSDDKNPVQDAGVLIRALLYVKTIGCPLLLHCEDKSISNNGDINEGVVNVFLGLRATPPLSEEIMVARNIQLAGYAGSRIHFGTISSGQSVELIAAARKTGIGLSAGIAAHQIALDETHLTSFSTDLKVNPPLRTGKDIRVLKKALADNIIDVICSDHTPEDTESKMREFDTAAFGITGLETLFALCTTFLGGTLSVTEIIDKIAVNPRKILNLEVPVISEGKKANCTFFDPARKWTFKTTDIRSKSRNTPFINREFTGKPLAIYNNGIFRRGGE